MPDLINSTNPLLPDKKVEKRLRNKQVAIPADADALTIPDTGLSNTYFDFQTAAATEFDLINKYLTISTYPDVFKAIEEIATEAISALDSESPIELDLTEMEYSDKFKNSIQDEFKTILSLLDFKQKAHDIFRMFYITGKCGYQIVMGDDGIEKLVFMDPRKFRKVRVVFKEKNQDGIEIIKKTEDFFIYNNMGVVPTNSSYNISAPSSSRDIRIPTNLVAYASSGLHDISQGMNLSFLHPALKPANQLSMLRDAQVVARVVRAPMRRMFKINVGNLPKNKADQYMRSVIAKYKNKIVYNSVEGTVKDQRNFMSILEDYWFPVDSEGKGHSVENIEGSNNDSATDDIENIQEELYRALQIPVGRFKESTVIFGRQSEVSRDELTFAKFINRLRRKFNSLFDDLLKTQLIAKSIIQEEDWDELKESLNYKYKQDQYFLEVKEAEILRNRLDLINQIHPYMGIYFSKEYIFEKVMKMSEEEVDEMKKQMEQDHSEEMERNLHDQMYMNQASQEEGEGQAQGGPMDSQYSSWSPPPPDERVKATQAAALTNSIKNKPKKQQNIGDDDD